MDTVRRTEEEIRAFADRALRAAGAAEWSAAALARVVAAEAAAALPGGGLARLLACCTALAEGRADGQAVPVVERPADAVVRVDAAGGLADPAIEAGLGELIPLARRIGAAVLALRRAAGPPGSPVHARWLAEEGLIALGAPGEAGAPHSPPLAGVFLVVLDPGALDPGAAGLGAVGLGASPARAVPEGSPEGSPTGIALPRALIEALARWAAP